MCDLCVWNSGCACGNASSLHERRCIWARWYQTSIHSMHKWISCPPPPNKGGWHLPMTCGTSPSYASPFVFFHVASFRVFATSFPSKDKICFNDDIWVCSDVRNSHQNVLNTTSICEKKKTMTPVIHPPRTQFCVLPEKVRMKLKTWLQSIPANSRSPLPVSFSLSGENTQPECNVHLVFTRTIVKTSSPSTAESTVWLVDTNKEECLSECSKHKLIVLYRGNTREVGLPFLEYHPFHRKTDA